MVTFLDDTQREEQVRQSHIETITALEQALKERDQEIVNLKENKAKLEDKLEKITKVFNRDQHYKKDRPNTLTLGHIL